MSLSLKSYCRKLGTMLGTRDNPVPADSIYERQRQLVDIDKMPLDPGRGPGSGVRLSAESVAWLLIAMLCADTTRAVSREAPMYYLMMVKDRARLKLPHGLKPGFGLALAGILADPKLSAAVDRVEVSRSIRRAVIHWKSGEPIVFESSRHLTSAGMTITATLCGAVLAAIADDLDHLKDEHKAVLVSTIKG